MLTNRESTTRARIDYQLIQNSGLTDEDLKARKWAIILAVLSMVTIGTLAGITMVIAVVYHSNAALVFAADGLLDALDGFVIIWRFYDVKQTYSEWREKVGCIAMAILSFLTSALLMVKSSLSMTDVFERIDTVDAIWILSTVDGVTCLLLAGGKFYAAYILRSLVVFTDGMASTLGAVMAFTSVACDIIIESHPNAWMMDPIVGYAFGVFFGLCGVWLLSSQIKRSRKDSLLTTGKS